MRRLLFAAPLVLLAGCGLSGTDDKKDTNGTTVASGTTTTTNAAVSAMAANDPDFGKMEQTEVADAQPRPDMQVQVVLDQLGFGPGVVDGKMGQSTQNGLKGFQEANSLTVSGKLDDATKMALAQWNNVPATKVVKIPESWGQIQFQPIPKGAEEQAKLPALAYQSVDEKLAERFHTTPDVLKMLNPGGQPAGSAAPPAGASASATATPTPKPSSTSTPSPSASPSGTVAQATFRPGQMVRVPNVGLDSVPEAATGDKQDWSRTLASLGVGATESEATKIVVDKSESVLRAYDAGGKLLALFTVTSGSSHDPLPLGEWKINVVSKNPPFHYNPDLFWDAKSTDQKQLLKPGPNSPVGVVWIDLNKEHYGIHGTPEPQTIGRTQSHGCVRLTNWDAARLATMVNTKTKVIFQA